MPKIVRPIQFDAKRKAQRNARASEARKRRESERTRMWRFLYRMIEPWDEYHFDRETLDIADRRPVNDNAARAVGQEGPQK